MKERTITFEQLIAYASGELRADEAALVEAHLAAAPTRAGSIARLREVLETMRQDDSEQPQQEVVQRAISAFADLSAVSQSGWLELARHVVASLVFDSRARPLMAGFRGGCAGYQLAYECEPARIDLQVSPGAGEQPGQVRVRGQVTARDAAVLGSVSVVDAGSEEVSAWAVPDRFGRFKLDLEGGAYDLLVGLDHGRLRVIAPGLDVSPA